MSDTPVIRTVGGPPARRAAPAPSYTPPREGAARSLIKSQRPAPGARTVPSASQVEPSRQLDPEPPPGSGVAPAETLVAEEQSSRVRRNGRPATIVKTTIEMPVQLRDRMRAVFRATSSIEGEDTLKEMLNKLIEQECSRREAIYNNGAPFDGGERNLPRGRPLGR